MVSVFSTRRASWVRLKSVRRCLKPSHSVSYEKNNNYTFHKTFTIHHPSHMHHQSRDYTEISKNMNIILYHSTLMHVILHRQNIYLFLITDHKPKINPLNPELNSICYLLALLAHHFLHVSRIMVKSLTLRLLMSYIYGAHILDVSRSHTTTQHSR